MSDNLRLQPEFQLLLPYRITKGIQHDPPELVPLRQQHGIQLLPADELRAEYGHQGRVPSVRGEHLGQVRVLGAERLACQGLRLPRFQLA